MKDKNAKKWVLSCYLRVNNQIPFRKSKKAPKPTKKVAVKALPNKLKLKFVDSDTETVDRKPSTSASTGSRDAQELIDNPIAHMLAQRKTNVGDFIDVPLVYLSPSSKQKKYVYKSVIILNTNLLSCMKKL